MRVARPSCRSPRPRPETPHITYAPARARISHGRNITTRASPARGSCFDTNVSAVTMPTTASTPTVARSEPTNAEDRAAGSIDPGGPIHAISRVATTNPMTAPTTHGRIDSSAALTPTVPDPIRGRRARPHRPARGEREHARRGHHAERDEQTGEEQHLDRPLHRGDPLVDDLHHTGHRIQELELRTVPLAAEQPTTAREDRRSGDRRSCPSASANEQIRASSSLSGGSS